MGANGGVKERTHQDTPRGFRRLLLLVNVTLGHAEHRVATQQLCLNAEGRQTDAAMTVCREATLGQNSRRGSMHPTIQCGSSTIS